MRVWLQLVVVFGVLGVLGQLRMSFEQSLTKELEAKHILMQPFDLESRASLSQKGFVASFGSLRPTLAALSALGSARHHGNQEWDKIEQTFETVALLDPYNAYYWDLGAWHMAYNASSAVREDTTLPPLVREKKFREWTEKGSAFYDRGIVANPTDLNLRLSKARLWSNPQRSKDFLLAAKTLENALAEVELTTKQKRKVRENLFYVLLRVPERVNDAYRLGRELYFEKGERRYPSLVNGLTALQMHPRVTVKEPLSLPQLYGTRGNAYKMLSNYLRDSSEDKPKYGVIELLERLNPEH